MGEAAGALASELKPGALVSDVGSSKRSITRALTEALPGQPVIPAHPVAGTEHSGPDAGFATLFHHRWCILTPPAGADPTLAKQLGAFWRALGSRVEVMDAEHHDLVLAVTSHIPHLIAYTIVGTASDLEEVTRGEVIKYSAGGFRDFTRIAASDPTMWRDVFLNNRDAVLEMLDRFLADLAHMREAIVANDGDSMFDLFTRTRAIRRGIIELGQDDARPDFGRADHG
jgi:cyclohexadieny/prephenate dehydrogenase